MESIQDDAEQVSKCVHCLADLAEATDKSQRWECGTVHTVGYIGRSIECHARTRERHATINALEFAVRDRHELPDHQEARISAAIERVRTGGKLEE